MMNGNGYSLSDIVAATGGSNNRGSNDGWGGDGAWSWIWVILILAIFWGGFGNGFGGFGGNGGGSAAQGALTREQACIDNNFQNLMRETAGISDAVNVGFANLNSTICQQQYDTAQMVNGLGTTIQGGFNAANIVALQNQNALQAQIAQCCCDNREALANLKYDMATSDCSIKTLINQLVQQLMWGQQSGIRDLTELINTKFCQLEMSQKDAVIADLRTQLASCGDQSTANYIINQLRGIISPTPVPAYPAASPCGLGNWAPQVLANGYGYYNGGCGCNANYANAGCGCC